MFPKWPFLCVNNEMALWNREIICFAQISRMRNVECSGSL